MDTASPSISPAELTDLLGGATPPLLLDVRRPQRHAESDWQLQGAIYCAPDDVAAFARSQPPREVVVYCLHGHEVSQEAARTLRDAGWNARYLEGGIEGPSSLPRVRK